MPLVLPEAVSENPDGTLAVSYGSLVPLLIQAVQEQKAETDSLKKQHRDDRNSLDKPNP